MSPDGAAVTPPGAGAGAGVGVDVVAGDGDGDGKVGNSPGLVSISPNAAGVGTGVDITPAYDCCGVACGVCGPCRGFDGAETGADRGSVNEADTPGVFCAAVAICCPNGTFAT